MQITQILVDERPRRPRIANHKSHLHKSQNQLKQTLWIHHPLASFRFFESVETQVGGRNRKKFRQAILLNGVTILRGNRKCYLRCVFFGAYTTHKHNLCKPWEDVGHFCDLCKSVFGYAPVLYHTIPYPPSNLQKNVSFKAYSGPAWGQSGANSESLALLSQIILDHIVNHKEVEFYGAEL